MEPPYTEADFFKTLTRPARIRMLELPAVRDRSVGEPLSELGPEKEP